MDYREVVSSLNADVVERLRDAVATGRWPDGRALTDEQRAHSLQAVLTWEAAHLPAEQRVGYIDKGRKAAAAGAPRPLRWADAERGRGSD